MKRLWMPLYVRDYAADTGHLSTLEHGAYLLLLMHYWTHGNVPCDEKRLALIAKLDPRTWRKVRPVLVTLFDTGWKHKRVDKELKKAWEISETRRASAQNRWSNRDAYADANASPDAMHEHAQPQSQSQSQLHKEKGRSGARAPADADDEERFWSRLKDLETKGISRSRCAQLLKANGNDFIEANRVLDTVETAHKPGQYLGAVIRNIQSGETGTPSHSNPHVPAWVNERRAAGILVERDGPNSWRSQGEILNNAGEVVGF